LWLSFDILSFFLDAEDEEKLLKTIFDDQTQGS
jgi:hypothetical protein